MNSPGIRILFGTMVGLAIALLLFFAPTISPAKVGSSGLNLTVNSTLDEPAADASKPSCISTPSGKCTLRAAIMITNFAAGPNTINLPAGTYNLTRAGYDDNALVGDLDIGHDLTIQGDGSGVTIVDGNGAVTGDRVFQVLITAQNVTLNGMAIRHGQSFSSTVGVIGGGGLYMAGAGNLHLSDVAVGSNRGRNGGGLYFNFASQGGSATLDNVVVYANVVTGTGLGAGGGVFANLPSDLSQVVIRDSQVISNTADGTGGGLYVDGTSDAQWSVQRSDILSNTAASGGGIGNFVPLTLSDSQVNNNHASEDGGAIEAFSPLLIERTTLDGNTALRFGGAIFDLQDSSSALYREFAHIEASTLSHNSAQYGGAIYHDGFIVPGSLLTMLNSTLSENAVYRPGGNSGSADGGGIYQYGGQAQLLNATVAANHVILHFPPTYSGIGGGLYITASATFTGLSSIIADNYTGNGFTVPTPDDCFSSGTVGTLGFNLILTTANCFVTGGQVGNIVGQDPLLGPLAFNGGSTQTQALPSDSPGVDTGAQTGCTDDLGAPLTTDQRGYSRPYNSRCDIGAFEWHPLQAPNQVAISGPLTGTVGTGYSFAANVSPTNATVALSYQWQATDQSPVNHTGNLTTTDSIIFTWATTGTKTITVTATNVAGSVSGTHLINVVQKAPKAYLPIVRR